SWTIDTTAPETTISGAPSAVSASNAATFTFTGSDAQGVAGFECALDGAAFSACSSPLGLSGLADGAHTLQVRAIDTAGNIDATPASHTWTVDTVAPDTAINGGPPSVSGSTTASISFSGSDANGVAGYECALDGGAYSACTSPVALSGLAEGAHTLRVRAIDTAGRVDASPAVHAWTTDLTPPDTTLLTQPPALTSSTSANVTFTGSDANGVASFECKLDNGAFTACSISTLLLGLSDGTHTFQVRAIDNAGWVDPSPASYTWTVDTTAPDTAILTNPAVVAGSTSATFTVSGSDLNGVASFACSLDGGSFVPCTTPHGLSGLADGVHTFQVRATDNAGNVDATPASYTWTVDTVAPETTLLTTPPSISNNTAATFTFSGSDANGVASFECALDGGSFVPCTSPAEYNGLGEGQHTFEVRAIDNAGRVDDSPVGYTWTVDLTPPDTAFLSTPAALSSNPAPAFTFTGSDQHGVASFECALDTGAFAPCSSPHTLADLSDGSHTVLVRAFDSAGNVDPSPATYTWTVDTTAPVSGASASGNLVNGWYVNSVSVALNASDANGVARISYQIGAGDWQTYAAPLTITSNGSHTINYYAVDASGNTEGVRSVTVQVDAVAPQVQFDPTASLTFYPLNATVVVSYSCNDPDGSGIASCTGSLPSGSTLDTGTAGTRTVTVTATDRVGKTTTQTITYQIGYQFQLQMSNTRLAPSMNSAIGGNTIVLKFSLGGNQGLNIFLAGYPKMQQINCSTRAPQGTAVALPVTGAGLQYLSNGVYQLSWVTQTSWNGTCRQVVLAFNDGSTYKLNFQFSAPRWSGD
ncbi:MAG: hypothetical protein DCC58_10080, partial [Chloroflexi bacterium]